MKTITIETKDLSSKQFYLIGSLLRRFECFFEKHAHKLEGIIVELSNLEFKVWAKDLEEINDIINCIKEAL